MRFPDLLYILADNNSADLLAFEGSGIYLSYRIRFIVYRNCGRNRHGFPVRSFSERYSPISR